MDNLVNQVSVIIPMFNNESTIERALLSIENQTRSDVINTVFVVDDGSSDHSIEKVEYLKNKLNVNITLLFNAKKGVSSARNFGASFVRTNWIAFLDADDFWLPNKFSMSISLLNGIKTDMFGGIEAYKGKPEVKRQSALSIGIRYRPVIQTTVVRREVFESVNGFNEDMNYSEDFDFALRVVQKFKVHVILIEDFKTNPTKERYGDFGLSSNMAAMQKGIEQSLSHIYKRGGLSKVTYAVLLIWNKVKYVRRIMNVHKRKIYSRVK